MALEGVPQPKTVDEWAQLAQSLSQTAAQYKLALEQKNAELARIQSGPNIVDFAHAIKQLNKNSTSRYKAPIPVFAGKESEDIDGWTFLIENMFQLEQIQGSEQPLIASGYLRDLALESYRQWANSEVLTWNKLKEKLLTRFRPLNFQSVLRSQLDQLRQDTSFSQYLNKFSSIMNKIQNMDEVDRIFYFIRGLASKTRAEVGYLNPKTLQEAIDTQVRKTFLWEKPNWRNM